MNYIVLDLEWNQSNEGKGQEVSDIPFEIIEIGAVKLDKDKNKIGEFNQLIQPCVYHEMHHITKKLIHIKMEELEHGKPFTDVLLDFLNWCGQDYIFCTWGPLDLCELQRNMRHYHLEPLSDGPLKFLDIQKLFSIAFEDRKSRRTLEFAVDFLSIEKDIPFHRAYSDAYYTAKIFKCIQDPEVEKNHSYDVFVLPKSKKEEIKVVFPDYTKYISRVFSDKKEALTDREVMSTRCYLCRRNLKKVIRWFTTNGKHYYAISFCECHGFLKTKIRLKKAEDDKIYVVKTSKFITEAQMKELTDKKCRSRMQGSKMVMH